MSVDASRPAERETFERFKDSFAYGERTDLLFKFLKDLSSQEAAEFLQALLVKVGQSADDGDAGRILDHVYEWQVRAYTPREHATHGGAWTYDEGPFVPLGKRVSEARVALLTSSGHFVVDDDPEPFGVKDMSQEASIPRILDFLRAKPELSVIAADTTCERLRVRHPGYDIRGALADANVVFPLERMRELEQAGEIGALASDAYSFVGAAAQGRIIKESGPEWAAMLRARGVEAVVLVPV